MRSSSRLLLSVLLASAVALGLFAAAASAAPKEVAYRCGADICLVDPDHPDDVTNLTDNGTTSYDEDPVWSPDGKRLAFVARFTGKFPPETNIYTMEPDAPDQSINIAVQVTHLGGGEVPTDELAWSPDGQRIAFARGIASAGNQPLWVVNSDGTTATPLALAPQGGHPSWAPDGGKIAYSFSHQVYLKNADGSGIAAPLPNGGGIEPAWSPSGAEIAFGFPAHEAEFLDLHVVSSTGGGTPTVTPSFTQWIYASWSPGGGQIAYRATDPANEGAGYVRIVNADGSGDHHLPIVQGLEFRGSVPSWSPDGRRLVFPGYLFGGDKSDKVYLANADGSGSATPITRDESDEPAWRPNPLAGPAPPVIAPSGGSAGPLPGPRLKPKIVWFTKRVPWTGGPYIPPMKVACGDVTCGANAVGRAKAWAPAGVRRRLVSTAASSGGAGKPKAVVVGRGGVHVPAGQTRKLKIKLTKAGIAVLEKAGRLKMAVTLTFTAAGAAPVRRTHTLEVVARRGKGKHRI